MRARSNETVILIQRNIDSAFFVVVCGLAWLLRSILLPTCFSDPRSPPGSALTRTHGEWTTWTIISDVIPTPGGVAKEDNSANLRLSTYFHYLFIFSLCYDVNCLLTVVTILQEHYLVDIEINSSRTWELV